MTARASSSVPPCRSIATRSIVAISSGASPVSTPFTLESTAPSVPPS